MSTLPLLHVLSFHTGANKGLVLITKEDLHIYSSPTIEI